MDEVILVDANDNPIGTAEKMHAHEHALLHRAFSVFIVDGRSMLLQQRALDKYHCGGLWTNACCSHQRKDEILSDAIHRRLQEELGIDCEVRPLFQFTYRTDFDNGLTEHELDHVYLGEYAGEVKPDAREIEQIQWIGLDELCARVNEHPEAFTYWFKQALPGVMGAIRNAAAQ